MNNSSMALLSGIIGVAAGYYGNTFITKIEDNQPAVLKQTTQQQVTVRQENSFETQKDIPSLRHKTDYRKELLIDTLADKNPDLFSKLSAEHQAKMRMRLFKKLAYQDPVQAAMLFDEIKNSDTKYLLMRILLTAWGEKDPQACHDWFKMQKGRYAEQCHKHYLKAVLVPLAKNDPEAALRILGSHEDLENKSSLLLEVAESWAQKDHRAAFDWLNSLWGSEKITPLAFQTIYRGAMKSYIKSDPAEAAKSLQEIKNPKLQQSLVRYAIRGLAEKNINSAMELALSFENPKSKYEGVNQMINSYARDNPAEILDFVMSNTGTTRKDLELITNAFAKASQQKPSLVAKRFNEIPEDARIDAIAPLIRNWIYIKPEEAIIWLDEQPSGAARDAGIVEVVEYCHNTDLDLAFDLAKQISDPKKQGKVLADLAERKTWQSWD